MTMSHNNMLVFLLYGISICYIILISHKKLFKPLIPLDIPEIRLGIKMVDTDPGEYPLSDAQIKYVRRLLRRSNLLWIVLFLVAEGVALYAINQAKEICSHKVATVLTAITVVANIYCIVFRFLHNKRVYRDNKHCFKRRQGCLINEDSRSIDVHYTAGGKTDIETYQFYKVTVGVYDWEGKPRAYSMRMADTRYDKLLKSGKCDVITFNDSFVAICDLKKVK